MSKGNNNNLKTKDYEKDNFNFSRKIQYKKETC